MVHAETERHVVTLHEFTRQIFGNYPASHAPEFPTRHFQPEHFHEILDAIHIASRNFISVRRVGESAEGRPIRLASVGSGDTRVLLWSQMHGDESTATMAIADILRFLEAHRQETPIARILSTLKLQFLPMLNPDGAARTQRRTAQEIDMNRDALALVTPEARLLKEVRSELQPRFGFNLHDQELSSVGTGRNLTAIALLAPAYDAQKSDNEVRMDAKHVAAVFASAMENVLPGRCARYDDTFEPRAFGDNMQKWGTSTLLVESGHEVDDPGKNVIRRLNFTGIMASLYGIATGEYRRSDIARYERLPFNGKKAYDVILRNVTLTWQDRRPFIADLGISYQVDTHSTAIPKLVDIGDLHTFIGLREIDAAGKEIPAAELRLGGVYDWEKALK
jgi:hypothetical protein